MDLGHHRRADGGRVFVEVNGEEVADVTYKMYGDRCQICFVWVDPAYRRQGLATRMLEMLRTSRPEVYASPVITTGEGDALKRALWGRLARPR